MIDKTSKISNNIFKQKKKHFFIDLIEDYDRLSKENMDYKTKLALEENCNW